MFLQVTLPQKALPYRHGLTFLTFRMQKLHFVPRKHRFGRELALISAGFVAIIAGADADLS